MKLNEKEINEDNGRLVKEQKAGLHLFNVHENNSGGTFNTKNGELYI